MSYRSVTMAGNTINAPVVVLKCTLTLATQGNLLFRLSTAFPNSGTSVMACSAMVEPDFFLIIRNIIKRVAILDCKILAARY